MAPTLVVSAPSANCLEPLPQPREIRSAVQAKLHAVVFEAVVGFIRVLLARFDVEDVGAADGELGGFVEAPGEAQIGRGLRQIGRASCRERVSYSV